MIRILRDRRANLLEQGRTEGRREATEYLRAQANLYRDGPSDAKRRGALNHAAHQIEMHRAPGRPG